MEEQSLLYPAEMQISLAAAGAVRSARSSPGRGRSSSFERGSQRENPELVADRGGSSSLSASPATSPLLSSPLRTRASSARNMAPHPISAPALGLAASSSHSPNTVSPTGGQVAEVSKLMALLLESGERTSEAGEAGNVSMLYSDLARTAEGEFSSLSHTLKAAQSRGLVHCVETEGDIQVQLTLAPSTDAQGPTSLSAAVPQDCTIAEPIPTFIVKIDDTAGADATVKPVPKSAGAGGGGGGAACEMYMWNDGVWTTFVQRRGKMSAAINEVDWMLFSSVELKNFLRILGEEEEKLEKLMRIKYNAKRSALERLIADMEAAPPPPRTAWVDPAPQPQSPVPMMSSQRSPDRTPTPQMASAAALAVSVTSPDNASPPARPPSSPLSHASLIAAADARAGPPSPSPRGTSPLTGPTTFFPTSAAAAAGTTGAGAGAGAGAPPSSPTLRRAGSRRNEAVEVDLRRSRVLSLRRRPSRREGPAESSLSTTPDESTDDMGALLDDLAAAEAGLMSLTDMDAVSVTSAASVRDGDGGEASLALAGLSGGLSRVVTQKAAAWIDGQIRTLMAALVAVGTPLSLTGLGGEGLVVAPMVELARHTAADIDSFPGVVEAAVARGAVRCAEATSTSEAMVVLLIDTLPDADEHTYTCSQLRRSTRRKKKPQQAWETDV